MLRARQLTRALSPVGGVWRGAAWASSSAAPPAALAEAYKKAAPNLDPPFTPSSFAGPRPPMPATIPEKLTLNIVVPHDLPYWNRQVDSVIIPATSGLMGVLPGHVPTIAELKPGVLSVLEGSTETKYFVSSGFAFVTPNSVLDVTALEVVPLDELDPEAVREGLALYTTKAASADSDLEKAEAQIGVEVHSAMSVALGL